MIIVFKLERGAGLITPLAVYSRRQDLDHLLSAWIALRAVAVAEPSARYFRLLPRMRYGRKIERILFRAAIALIERQFHLMIVMVLFHVLSLFTDPLPAGSSSPIILPLHSQFWFFALSLNQ